MLTEVEELEYIDLLKQEMIDKARDSFWDFCNLLSPDFYRSDRIHLKQLCDTLQSFYYRELTTSAGKPAEKLIIEMPPRHGKSRTLTNFSAWALGRNHIEKIITASYSDDLAQDFSRNTRDIISQEKNTPDEIVYSDIFPETKIKKGDAAYHKWAIEGQFFNYKGCGVGGSITGRGGSLLIVDDPIKDAETAYSETALEKIWRWYTGTFISRTEEGALQIICMTPWSKNDISAKVQALEPDKTALLTMPAIQGDSMLCPALLSRESYESKKAIADEAIFAANYDMQRLDIKGRLYSGFQTYSVIPDNARGKIGYVDTADDGKDYLCAILGVQTNEYIYITDILFTQDAQELTEPKLCDMIAANGTREIMVESNNGGRAFARNIQRILQERRYSCAVQWFHQTSNKQARILTNAPIAQKYLLLPEGWAQRWQGFYSAIMSYQREGKNKHDDAPDCITGLIEHYGMNANHVSIPRADIRALARI